jgi:hypothetical protein
MNYSKLNKHKRTALIVVFLWVQLIPVSLSTGGPQEKWEYLATYEGVDLFRHSIETDHLLPFRAEAVLEVPYDRIVMALIDTERKNRWAPKLKSTTIHSQISSNCFVYSEYYTTPWPFEDREFLLKGRVIYLNDRIVFQAENAENKMFADTGHLCADIKQLEFAIIPLAENKTRVSFTFSGDIGGWIPSYVKTIIQKKWPVRFIQSLNAYIAETDSIVSERYRLLEKQRFTMDESMGKIPGH